MPISGVPEPYGDSPYEVDDEDLYETDDEAVPQRVRTAWAGSYFRPRMPAQGTQSYVTQSQLQQALSGVQSDMRKNAGAVRAVDGRVAALGRRTRKDITGVRNDMSQAVEMMALLPMLSQGSPVTVGTAAAVGDQILPAGTKVAEPSSGITALLPLILLSGTMGGLAGTSSSSSSGSQDSMLMLVLAMSMMNK